MKVYTLTTDVAEITTQVFATGAEVYHSVRSNFDPEGELEELSDGEVIEELTSHRGVVLYIDEHDVPLGPDVRQKMESLLQYAANTANGDSNDEEIEAWRDAAEALAALHGLTVPDPEEEEDDDD